MALSFVSSQLEYYNIQRIDEYSLAKCYISPPKIGIENDNGKEKQAEASKADVMRWRWMWH